MKPEQILPSLLIVIDLCASAVCWWQGDVRRAVYWAAAAILTASVTY